MPGIAELIPALDQSDDVCLALLSGNWQTSGRIKLDYFGLNDYFPFGAFGDDSSERSELVPIAVERFTQKYGIKPLPKDVYVIGDTPADIQCAKAHGAISVAVAAASYSVKDLQCHEPDYLFKDLSDTKRIIKLLT